MDEAVTRLIGNVGFPIGAFLMLYRLVTGTLAENTRAVQELRAAVTELRAALVQAAGGKVPKQDASTDKSFWMKDEPPAVG
ncbi:MAG: hypothetical protein ACP5R4_07295 [Armatimonadota bacterium]